MTYEQGKNKEIAKSLNIEFRTTIVVYKGNKEVSRVIGQTEKEIIYSAIREGI